jgi:hypothetical protein
MDQDLKGSGIPMGHRGEMLGSIAELRGTALPPPQLAPEGADTTAQTFQRRRSVK